VENDRCESQSSAVRRKFLMSRDPGEWTAVSMQLKAGVNVLSWQVYTLPSQTVSVSTSSTVKIRMIQIRGQHTLIISPRCFPINIPPCLQLYMFNKFFTFFSCHFLHFKRLKPTWLGEGLP